MLSLPSTSFTYYPSSDKLQHISENDNGLQLFENYVGSDDQQGINTPSKNTDIEPPLVHSVSIYRKQQQMLRSSGTPSSKVIFVYTFKYQFVSIFLQSCSTYNYCDTML